MAQVYFTTTPIGGVPNLWLTDGTLEGTQRFPFFEPFSGDGGGSTRELTPFGSQLLFSSASTPTGTELWITDGTDEGTRLVRDINAVVEGPSRTGSSSPTDITLMGGRAYFWADDGVNGDELWTSDGTELGTFMVRDLTPGPGGSYSVTFDGSTIASLGDQIIFSVGGDSVGFSIWSSDGSSVGTIKLADFAALPDHFHVFGDRLLFAGNDGETGTELWITDGTPGGTFMVRDLNEGGETQSSLGTGAPYISAQLGGLHYFAATALPDDEHTLLGELWVTDGTEAGTRLVVDVRDDDPFGSNVQNLIVYDGKVFFTATDGVIGQALYVVNGLGAELVKDINVNTGTGGFSGMTVSGGKLFFATNDGVNGEELWVSDGTSDGTVMVKDINPGASSSNINQFIAAYGHGVVFQASTPGTGDQLWFSDGTEAGTVQISDFETSNTNPMQFTLFGDIRFTGFGDNVVLADTGESVEALGGDDGVTGGTGDDDIDGGDGFDTLVGGDGNDTLDGGANPEGQGDFLLGGDGDDTYLVDSSLDFVDEGNFPAFAAFGFGGTDTIVSTADFFWDLYSIGETLRISEDAVDPEGDGTTAVHSVFSGEVIGNSATNILFGRGGSDTYRAGDGTDFISLSTLGLTEENAYEGVDGVNTVIVEERASGDFSYDIVFEFEAGKDKLDVSDYGFASAAAALATGVDDGAGNSYFILGDGLDYLYMVGVTLGEMSAGDFIV